MAGRIKSYLPSETNPALSRLVTAQQNKTLPIYDWYVYPHSFAPDLVKHLIKDYYLAKSMSLQKGFSGARLLIDNQLARDIFRHNNCQDWATFEGYANSIARDVPLDSPIRRICPVPSGQLYEFLYFWLTDQQQYNIPAIREKLTHTSTMTNSEINKHYSDTLCLLERSVEQRNYSENLIFPRNNH